MKIKEDTYLLMMNDRIDFKHSDFCEYSLGGHDKSFNKLEDLIHFTFQECVMIDLYGNYDKKDLDRFFNIIINEVVCGYLPEENQENHFIRFKKDLIDSINKIEY